jgi:hypothetical protein
MNAVSATVTGSATTETATENEALNENLYRQITDGGSCNESQAASDESPCEAKMRRE